MTVESSVTNNCARDATPRAAQPLAPSVADWPPQGTDDADTSRTRQLPHTTSPACQLGLAHKCGIDSGPTAASG
jgi:hypothetical protein